MIRRLSSSMRRWIRRANDPALERAVDRALAVVRGERETSSPESELEMAASGLGRCLAAIDDESLRDVDSLRVVLAAATGRWVVGRGLRPHECVLAAKIASHQGRVGIAYANDAELEAATPSLEHWSASLDVPLRRLGASRRAARRGAVSVGTFEAFVSERLRSRVALRESRSLDRDYALLILPRLVPELDRPLAQQRLGGGTDEPDELLVRLTAWSESLELGRDVAPSDDDPRAFRLTSHGEASLDAFLANEPEDAHLWVDAVIAARFGFARGTDYEVVDDSLVRRTEDGGQKRRRREPPGLVAAIREKEGLAMRHPQRVVARVAYAQYLRTAARVGLGTTLASPRLALALENAGIVHVAPDDATSNDDASPRRSAGATAERIRVAAVGEQRASFLAGLRTRVLRAGRRRTTRIPDELRCPPEPLVPLVQRAIADARAARSGRDRPRRLRRRLERVLRFEVRGVDPTDEAAFARALARRVGRAMDELLAILLAPPCLGPDANAETRRAKLVAGYRRGPYRFVRALRAVLLEEIDLLDLELEARFTTHVQLMHLHRRSRIDPLARLRVECHAELRDLLSAAIDARIDELTAEGTHMLRLAMETEARLEARIGVVRDAAARQGQRGTPPSLRAP